ncbi:MAG: cell envelope integrity protein CreD [Gammaproteobacteria bacterium]|nr:cell envelope integrity protein CreD [Gammaproteobacteria bacterium]
MTKKRIFALVLIFMLGVAGWYILGAASSVRSASALYGLNSAMYTLWGRPIVQEAPSFTVKVPGTKRTRTILPASNQIKVGLDLEQRRKGLIWYPTYVSDFDATYRLINHDAVAQKLRIHFKFPSQDATYDSFKMWLDGKAELVEVNPKQGIRKIVELAPGQGMDFRITYTTRGLGQWLYKLAPKSGRVLKLDLDLTTNFKDVDFPESSLSPMLHEMTEGGTHLRWQADDLITRQNVAISMPEKLNPGPLSARMSFFAPVCLLFFFILITAIAILRSVNIHPMHYLFVTAGFFAFHLLFAYLVDLVNIHLAFGVASLVSVGLVIAYLRHALGERFPWKIAGAGQIFYLVLFSYSFFLKGMTGLVVTIGSVITLAVLMYMTARLDWNQVFARQITEG